MDSECDTVTWAFLTGKVNRFVLGIVVCHSVECSTPFIFHAPILGITETIWLKTHFPDALVISSLDEISIYYWDVLIQVWKIERVGVIPHYFNGAANKQDTAAVPSAGSSFSENKYRWEAAVKLLVVVTITAELSWSLDGSSIFCLLTSPLTQFCKRFNSGIELFSAWKHWVISVLCHESWWKRSKVRNQENRCWAPIAILNKSGLRWIIYMHDLIGK